MGGLAITSRSTARVALVATLALVAIIVPVAVAMPTSIPADTVPPEFVSVAHCHIEPASPKTPSTATCPKPEHGSGETGLDMDVVLPTEMAAGAHTITWTGASSGTPVTKSGVKLEAGTYKATWTASDEAKNVSTVEQVIIVADTKPPRFKPGIKTSSMMEANKVMKNINSEDHGVAVTNPSDLSGPIMPNVARIGLGKHTITWTATDGAGNTSTMTQEITVKDTVPPMVECEDLTIEATGAPTSLTAQNARVEVTDAATADDNIRLKAKPSSVAIGDTERVVWTATDGAGLTGTCAHDVTVRDSTRPSIRSAATPETSITTLPAVTVLATGASTTASPSAAGVTATDAPRVEIPTIEAKPLSLRLGTQTVTWTAIDSEGNRSPQVTQQVKVVDPTFKVTSIGFSNGGIDLTFSSNVDAQTTGDILIHKLGFVGFGSHSDTGLLSTITTNGNTVRVEPRWYSVADNTVPQFYCYIVRANANICDRSAWTGYWVLALPQSLSSTSGDKLYSGASPDIHTCAGRGDSGEVAPHYLGIPGCLEYDHYNSASTPDQGHLWYT